MLDKYVYRGAQCPAGILSGYVVCTRGTPVQDTCVFLFVVGGFGVYFLTMHIIYCITHSKYFIKEPGGKSNLIMTTNCRNST